MNRIVSPSVALALGLALNAPASNRPAYAPPKPSAGVEALKLDWHDAKRDRAVPVKIYFPKDGAGALPIVIFSHGLGGSRDGYEFLGRHWAGCGYASVHLQHIGSDSAVWRDAGAGEGGKALQKSGANLANSINRPLDVRLAIDELIRLNDDAKSPLKGRLDGKRIRI